MKILFISHLFPSEHEPYNGIFNLQRVKALKKKGHEIIVVVPVSITPPLKYLFPLIRMKKIKEYFKNVWSNNAMQDQIPVYYLKWIALPRKILWRYQHAALNFCIKRKMAEIIDIHKPEIVITSVLHPEGSYAKYLKRIYNLPVISIAEGSELLIYPQLYKGIEKIINTINAYCDKIVFVSQNMAERVLSKYNVKNHCVINNGYETEWFFYSPRNDGNKTILRIVSVGSLSFIKGHDLLLEAVKNLSSAELTIIGAGDLHQEYTRFINENNLSRRVTIKEPIKPAELREEFLKYDVFCMPSRSEGSGIVSLEALACGLPVVVSKTGIIPEIIRNGENGFIVNELTSICLQENLIKAVNQKWNKKSIAESVLNYNWDKWAEEMTKIINNTCKLK